MLKKIFPFLVLISICGSLPAQSAGTISGKVTDKQSGETMPFASVFLFLEKDSAIFRTASTDFDGAYAFSSLGPGTYRVRANYVGCRVAEVRAIKVTAGATSKVDIAIEAQVTLEEVQIVQRGARSLNVSCVSYCTITREDLKAGKAGRRSRRRMKAVNMQPTANYTSEEYARVDDNEFREVKSSPLSTFSVDVDRASYSNIRRFIQKEGQLPPADAVRVEEMINYFQYNYPAPEGSEPFTIRTQYTECPWNKEHNLLHIGMRGRDLMQDTVAGSNLVFLIDVSGSMSSADKLPLLKNGLELLVQQLSAKDKIALVVYAGAAGVVLNPTPGNEKETILSALRSLESGGSTAGGEGLELAYKIAKQNFDPKYNNRVILATDGDFNVGVSSFGDLTRLIESKRETGVYLTVLGFGTGNYRDETMEQLADRGNGNYAYIDNILEAQKVLVKEMNATLHTVAKDVKLQLEFNPSLVKAYRLVGYENRMLKDEDFNNDKKDAGDMGAGHTVTAIYEIVPASSKEKLPDVDGLKYQATQTTPDANTNELLTIKCRYKKPGKFFSTKIAMPVSGTKLSFDEVSEDCKFSCAVAEFGMLLRNSSYKGTSSYKGILKQAKAAQGKDEEGYRAEFISLVEKAETMNK